MCAHTAPRPKNAKCSRHGLYVPRLRAFPSLDRAKRLTSAQSHAHRAAASGPFSSLVASRLMCTGTNEQKADGPSAWRDASGSKRMLFPANFFWEGKRGIERGLF
jgi:hypothetical protein